MQFTKLEWDHGYGIVVSYPLFALAGISHYHTHTSDAVLTDENTSHDNLRTAWLVIALQIRLK